MQPSTEMCLNFWEGKHIFYPNSPTLRCQINSQPTKNLASWIHPWKSRCNLRIAKLQRKLIFPTYHFGVFMFRVYGPHHFRWLCGLKIVFAFRFGDCSRRTSRRMVRSSVYILEILLMAEIRRLPVEVGSLSHYLQGFIIHSRWWSPDFWTIKQ